MCCLACLPTSANEFTQGEKSGSKKRAARDEATDKGKEIYKHNSTALVQGKGSNENANGPWVMMTHGDVTLLVHTQSAMSLVLSYSGLSGRFRFSVSAQAPLTLCSVEGNTFNDFDCDGDGLSKSVAQIHASIKLGDGCAVCESWSWGPWRAVSATPKPGCGGVKLAHAKWPGLCSLVLTDQGFVFYSSEKTLIVEDGRVKCTNGNGSPVLCVSTELPDAEMLAEKPCEEAWSCNEDMHKHPELAFKVGLALGLSFLSKGAQEGGGGVGRPGSDFKEQESDFKITSQGDYTVTSQIHDFIQKLKGLAGVRDMATRASLLAGGGNELHLAAASGDVMGVMAALKHTAKCQSRNTSLDEQNFKIGERVILAQDYLDYNDAGHGPLVAGEVGTIRDVRSDGRGGRPRVQVEFDDAQWWYDKPALSLYDVDASDPSAVECCCVNCVNVRDIQGRTPLHVAAASFAGQDHLRVIEAFDQHDARLHSRTNTGLTALHYLLESPAALAPGKPSMAFFLAIDHLASTTAVYQNPDIPLGGAEGGDKKMVQLSPIICSLKSKAESGIFAFERLLAIVQMMEFQGTSGEEDSKLPFKFKQVYEQEVELDDGENLTVLQLTCRKLEEAKSVHARQAAGMSIARLLSGCKVKYIANNGLKFCSFVHPQNSEIPVESALAAIGLAFNNQSCGEQGLPFSGIKTDLSLAQLLSDGWKIHLQQIYSTATQRKQLDPGKGKYLLVGARKTGSDAILLAAVAKREDVLQGTVSSQTHLANNVHWYCEPSKAFGFSPNSKINLRTADTLDDNGSLRLSWHLSGGGGWRAGKNIDLGSGEQAASFEKLVLVSPHGGLHARAICDELFQGRKVGLTKQILKTETLTAYRNDGTTLQITAQELDENMATVLERGTGKCEGTYRVTSNTSRGAVTLWIEGNKLMPVGAGFPAQVSLAQCRLKSLLPGFKLRSLVCFPLQAVQNLSLADNFLQELPEDFATAFPALASLDLSRNLFASFPPALAECLWLKDIQLKNNAHLSEDKWLDVIVAKYPSFLTHPPPMLEHIVLDFPAACSHSHTLLVTLAARTIERSTATCIPLANRGLGDAEIRAITPNLVEACRRRQSVGQALNANLRPLASKVKLSLIHRHRLKPGISEGAWCNMCGRYVWCMWCVLPAGSKNLKIFFSRKT